METTETNSKKQKKRKRKFTPQSLMDKKYQAVELNAHYKAIMGEIEANCTIIVYGPSTSGKTVFTLQLADYLAEHFGKVFYDSHEEGVNKTVQNRVKNFGIKSKRLHICDSYEWDELVEEVDRCKYRVVVRDSIQMSGMTAAQLKAFRAKFAKRKIIFIMVSFGEKPMSTKGANDLLHDSDVKIFIKGGKLTSLSRYLGEPAHAVLYNAKETGKPNLFNQ